MTKFEDLLHVYSSHHTKKVTKISHFVGVPIIFLAIQIFLSRFYFAMPALSLAWMLLIILVGYYLYLNIYLAVVTTLCLIPITCMAQVISTQCSPHTSFLIAGILFSSGWIALFVGHYFEGKSPAFLKNALQILIAPIFIASELSSMLFPKQHNL